MLLALLLPTSLSRRKTADAMRLPCNGTFMYNDNYYDIFCDQGLVEKQLFIADKHVTLNLYISTSNMAQFLL